MATASKKQPMQDRAEGEKDDGHRLHHEEENEHDDDDDDDDDEGAALDSSLAAIRDEPSKEDDASLLNRILTQMAEQPMARIYPDLLKQCQDIVRHHFWTQLKKHRDSNNNVKDDDDDDDDDDAARTTAWHRILRHKSGRFAKEWNEAAVVLHHVVQHVQKNDTSPSPLPYIILDACSGVGITSLFLSYLLPPDRVACILAMDANFAMLNHATTTTTTTTNNTTANHESATKPKEINPDTTTTGHPDDGETTAPKSLSSTTSTPALVQTHRARRRRAAAAARRARPHHLTTAHLTNMSSSSKQQQHPIPIHVRKVNLKKAREWKQVIHRYIQIGSGGDDNNNNNNNDDQASCRRRRRRRHPVILFGIHLCKSLSVHAIRLWHAIDDGERSIKDNSNNNHDSNPNDDLFVLKPCCLPGQRELQRKTPPFWSFPHVQPHGGIGLKLLYCPEIGANTTHNNNGSK